MVAFVWFDDTSIASLEPSLFRTAEQSVGRHTVMTYE